MISVLLVSALIVIIVYIVGSSDSVDNQCGCLSVSCVSFLVSELVRSARRPRHRRVGRELNEPATTRTKAV